MRHLLFLPLLLLSALSIGQITSTATGDGGSGYPALLESGFLLETPDCVHDEFGAHVTQTFDEELARNVFVFHSHIEADNDRCLVFDRVRMEIKGSASSDVGLQHELGDTTHYRWKFRLDEGYIGASSFNHLFQNKAVGGDDTGFPILTLTARADRLEVKHDGGDTGADLGAVAQADIELFRGRWIEAYLRQVHRENGVLKVTLRDMETGLTVLEYTNNDIDLWREGASFNRPKWGIYRARAAGLRDETARFANFCVSESGEALCPAEAVLQPDTVAPTAPADLAVTGTTVSTVDLSWSAASDLFGVTAYTIYRDGDSVAVTESTTASITDLAGATTYSFSVSARDAAGNESARSGSVDATTVDPNAPPGVVSAPRPADGSTDVVPSQSLSWTAGSNTDSYEVFFGTESDPPSVGTRETTTYQPVLLPNTTYFWRVTARNAVSETAGPTWTFTTGDSNDDAPWSVFRGNARPEVETNFFALNSIPDVPVLDEVIADPDQPGNNIYGYRSTPDDNFKWRYTLEEQDSAITVVARIRGIDDDADGMMHIDIRAFGFREKVRINNGNVKLERATPRVDADLPFDWNEDYHIIRVVFTGRVTRIYLDEDPTPFLTGTTEETTDRLYIDWGKSGGDDYGAYVDWLAVNPSEASVPAAGTPLPADLFPSSTPDWQVYRAIDRPQEESDLYELNTAPDQPVVDTLLPDPNGSDNTFYAFRSDSDNFRWRTRFTDEDTTLTVAARLKAIDPDVRGIIYFEFRLGGWRQKIRIDQRSIKIEKTDPVVEADNPFSWNDRMHLIRFVVRGAETLIYLDEDPEPFLRGTSTEETGSDYFEWGKSGGFDYGAIVDWITVTSGGGFAPGEGPSLPEDLFLSSDAGLRELLVDGIPIDSFRSDSTEYRVDVAGGFPPMVSWVANSDLASVSVLQAASLADTAWVTVLAQDGFTTRTYRVSFAGDVATYSPVLQGALRVYPVPATAFVQLALPEGDVFAVRLFSMEGREVLHRTGVRNGERIELAGVPGGVYVLTAAKASGEFARRRILIR